MDEGTQQNAALVEALDAPWSVAHVPARKHPAVAAPAAAF
jgi:hypothetical protein